MSNCYHPELKIAFVHTPKCAGTSISRVLIDNGFISAEDDKWYNRSYDQLCDIPNIDEYHIFTVIRNPVTWATSGYKFCNYWKLSFEQHMQSLIAPWNVIKDADLNALKTWYWHCVLPPDHHFPHNINVFKMEEMNKVDEFISDLLGKEINTPVVNKTNGNVDISDAAYSLIEDHLGDYARRWKYEI